MRDKTRSWIDFAQRDLEAAKRLSEDAYFGAIVAYVLPLQSQELICMKPQRISIERARKIALPILMHGFDKRRKTRSTSEEKLRVPEKLARDRQFKSEPHICSI